MKTYLYSNYGVLPLIFVNGFLKLPILNQIEKETKIFKILEAIFVEFKLAVLLFLFLHLVFLVVLVILMNCVILIFLLKCCFYFSLRHP